MRRDEQPWPPQVPHPGWLDRLHPDAIRCRSHDLGRLLQHGCAYLLFDRVAGFDQRHVRHFSQGRHGVAIDFACIHADHAFCRQALQTLRLGIDRLHEHRQHTQSIRKHQMGHGRLFARERHAPPLAPVQNPVAAPHSRPPRPACQKRLSAASCPSDH